jgi:hypothetical protein
MTKIKNTISPGKMRSILAVLAILCLLGVGFISLTVGISTGEASKGLQITSTPGELQSGTPSITEKPNEPDVTIGLVLAGVLLMVVILFGTLHATRGLKPPPDSQ